MLYDYLIIAYASFFVLLGFFAIKTFLLRQKLKKLGENKQ